MRFPEALQARYQRKPRLGVGRRRVLPPRSYDPRMGLQFLDFDFSGDAEGEGSFDAMASAAPAQLSALQAEVACVLGWAERHFGPAAALEEGGDWDYALRGVRELATPLVVRYVSGATVLQMEPGEPDAPRVTLMLTLSGTAAFCDALRAAFDLD